MIGRWFKFRQLLQPLSWSLTQPCCRSVTYGCIWEASPWESHSVREGRKEEPSRGAFYCTICTIQSTVQPALSNGTGSRGDMTLQNNQLVLWKSKNIFHTFKA